MGGRFSRLEARMETLVEGTFARWFAGSVHPRDIAIRLARALEDSAAAGAPATHYAVHLHPAEAQILLQAYPDLAELYAAELVALAREAQLTLPQPPEVTLLPDPVQRPRSVRVAAEAPWQAPSATQTMLPVQPAEPPVVPKAFLILDGERTVVITEAVITLGRRLDNHIILDDPRVSRTHAQLRLRFGRYVLYDLGSRGGTFVNGQRVDECVLRPGDVISLGGVPIIYGEDGLSEPPARPARPASHRADPGTSPLDPRAVLPPKDTTAGS